MTLESKLEALLFWKGEPMTIGKAATALGCTEEELSSALESLSKTLEGRGLAVVRNGDEIEMRTAAGASEFIMKLTKDELVRDLGKAGLETLTIILYKNPIKRAEIDYIRGVNSSFILRNLLIRGLIERSPGFAYKPTVDLLSHLGISRVEDLPEYAKVKEELLNFTSEEEKQEKASENG